MMLIIVCYLQQRIFFNKQQKCVLTSNSGRAVDANTGKTNNLEHLDFAELSKEYSVDCNNIPADCKDLYDEIVQDPPPHFHGRIL